ncbi:hypothetical protein [Burkholderia contaminans]|uniref:hypothetical protein n=1 Tax=Burkholderia contaminans TaxID=488447 RepID=UPI003D6703E5
MRPDVQDDRDRRLQVARKSRNEGTKRIDATRRRTDCDEVPMNQCASDIPAVSSVDPHRTRILHFFENVFTVRPIGPEKSVTQFLYRTSHAGNFRLHPAHLNGFARLSVTRDIRTFFPDVLSPRP